MTRLVSVTVLVAVLAASRLASAQSTGDGSDSGDTGSLPNGATFQFLHLKTFDLDDKKFEETSANTDGRRHGFNRAACNCARTHTSTTVPQAPDPKSLGWFQYNLTLSAATGLSRRPVDFWVGAQCETDATRTTNCRKLPYLGISDIDAQLFNLKNTVVSFNLYDVVNGNLHVDGVVDTTTDPNAGRCQDAEGNALIYAFVNTTSTGTGDSYDVKFSLPAGSMTSESSDNGVDTKRPPAPSDLKASASDESINLHWTPPTSGVTDIAYYQALCADMTNSVARSRASGARYVTTASQCSDADPLDLTEEAPVAVASSAANETAVAAPGGAYGQLDQAYICGEVATGTSKSMQITGLKNGTPYQIMLVTVDLFGNYSAQYLDHTVTPIPVTDFWEDLHGDGNEDPKGGLCLLAETYGDNSSLTNTLRAFRDGTLGDSVIGRWLGQAYYASLGKLGSVVHGSLALRIVAGVVLAPVVAFALLWHWLTLPGLFALLVIARLAWRRRSRLATLLRTRRWGWGLAGGALVLALAPGLARADKGQPYWENDPLDKSQDAQGAPSDPNYDPTFDSSLETHDNNRSSNPFLEDKDKDQDTPVGPGPSHWHVGIKIGPYFPDIDKQAGKPDYGPYRQMFGGYNLMPMLDFERVLFNVDYGQITVGLTAGYLQKTADGFVDGSTPGDHNRMRVPGATNKFQLLPTALTAGFRFTYLDDAYGIPVIPYVRGGLSYYLWRVTAPNGETAEICNASGDCSNSALGASLGVQGAIGLAVRLERIDAGTAQSMRSSGIQHIGVYGELSIAKVDGFGSDSKLSVGDRTWFAGVDFEF